MRSIKSFSFDGYKQTIKTDTVKKHNISSISKSLFLEPLQKIEPIEEQPPIWRHAFALADNVRFTRTPDIEILRKKAKDNPAYANQLKAIYERQQKPAILKAKTIDLDPKNEIPSVISSTPEIILVTEDAKPNEVNKDTREVVLLEPNLETALQPIHEITQIPSVISNTTEMILVTEDTKPNEVNKDTREVALLEPKLQTALQPIHEITRIPSVISNTTEMILIAEDTNTKKVNKNTQEIVLLEPKLETALQPIHEITKIKQQKSNTMFANKLDKIETLVKVENTQSENKKLAMIGISDFAFFEFEPFELGTKENDEIRGKQNPNQIEKELPQQSITELFRVLECKFSKSGRMEAIQEQKKTIAKKHVKTELETKNTQPTSIETTSVAASNTTHTDNLQPIETLPKQDNEQAQVTIIQNVNTSVNIVNVIDNPQENTITSLTNQDTQSIVKIKTAATSQSCAIANDNIIDLDELDYSPICENIEPNEQPSNNDILATTTTIDNCSVEQNIEVESKNCDDAETLSQNTIITDNITIEQTEKEEIATDTRHATSNNATTKNVAITPRHVTDLHSGLHINKQVAGDNYIFPSVELLQPPVYKDGAIISQETLERSAGLLESVLEDFGIKGEIIHVRPGPVVTLYEFEPAPGVKSSRVIGLADDIARSMSAISARVAVIPGRNVIGIELPNAVRETVFLREIVQSKSFETSDFKLALALGKNIGGEPIIAELAKMPHLLVAGTTGSGKSVAINTMILSLLYHLTPDQCRLIMVDPKMLELSIYDGIPHLLTPVVTDPKKAVTALKWAVREMEDRYRKMAKLGVRNIDGFNERVKKAVKNGETIMCTVQAGFDKETGELLYNEEAMDLNALPYIVIIVDEMADLMMVAGKEIESAIQRLAQMARAAGIHLIMATQRPSVDVITGTIKANFPTRISFQVTSKIDSRTILGEQGAETLLGQGDMLHMAGGGRIVRVHGAFVSDSEVEHIVSHLKTQGTPEYLATVTDSQDDEPEDHNDAIIEPSTNTGDESEALYAQAIKVVMRDKKCSTSYIQRRLSIGYNKAASLVERMEKEGLVGLANHVGKREILIKNH